MTREYKYSPACGTVFAPSQEMHGLGNVISLNGGPPPAEMPLHHSAVLFGHAILVGSVLALLTRAFANGSAKNKTGSSEAGESSEVETDSLVSSSNVLFLCVGMTAVMILINDNLARAFATGAAVALVRFRIKVAEKFLGMALFYAVLTGMACGLNRADIAWTATLIFGTILFSVWFLRRKHR